MLHFHAIPLDSFNLTLGLVLPFQPRDLYQLLCSNHGRVQSVVCPSVGFLPPQYFLTRCLLSSSHSHPGQDFSPSSPCSFPLGSSPAREPFLATLPFLQNVAMLPYLFLFYQFPMFYMETPPSGQKKIIKKTNNSSSWVSQFIADKYEFSFTTDQQKWRRKSIFPQSPMRDVCSLLFLFFFSLRIHSFPNS